MNLEEFKANMTSLRESIAEDVNFAVGVKRELTDSDLDNKGEAIANVVLAYRHMEDAAMRFGKAIQAVSGGVSPLGGPNSPQ